MGAARKRANAQWNIGDLVTVDGKDGKIKDVLKGLKQVYVTFDDGSPQEYAPYYMVRRRKNAKRTTSPFRNPKDNSIVYPHLPKAKLKALDDTVLKLYFKNIVGEKPPRGSR